MNDRRLVKETDPGTKPGLLVDSGFVNLLVTKKELKRVLAQASILLEREGLSVTLQHANTEAAEGRYNLYMLLNEGLTFASLEKISKALRTKRINVGCSHLVHDDPTFGYETVEYNLEVLDASL